MNITALERPASLVERVCQQLAELIRGGSAEEERWLPGERSLAEKLGVSRTVVREATKRLEQQGMLEIQHGTGIKIVDRLHRPLNDSLTLLIPDMADRLQQLNDARLSIEPDAAAYAAYRTEALAELKQIPAYSGLDKEDAATNILRVAQPPAASDSETVKSTWAVANKLAAKYGFFEFVGKEIFDFQTDRIYVPAGLFRNAIAETSADGTKKRGDSSTPLVVATVHCTTTSQMLGMAEGDLYLLQARQPFFLNYLKMAFGIWCLVLIAVGLAVALSTYLDAVVTLLAVLFLFVLGLCSGFIYELSQNIGKTNGQSGPFVSLNQLAQAKQPTAQPTGTTVEKVADTLDLAFRWVFRRIISVLPDIDAFRWTDYVAEGFDIPLEAMGMNVLVLLAYLFPWFALSYFLIRGREIAA